MAEENKEQKKVLEREYIVPLRKGWLKVPEYKRANKAVKTLKEFIARHMKVYDRDLRKIKLDVYLNNELRFRGMKKPLHKIKVKAIKYDNDLVEVKLAEVPKIIEYKIAREAKRKLESVKKAKEKVEEQKKEEAKPAEGKKEEVKEKEEASKIATEKLEKEQAKEVKHTSKEHIKEPKIQRKVLKK